MLIRESNFSDYPKLYSLFKKNDFLGVEIKEEDFIETCKRLYSDKNKAVIHEYTAEKNDDLIAHYGAVPLKFRVGDEVFPM